MTELINSWESQGRSVLRVIFAFTLSLHGFREVVGWPSAGRGRGAFMALDSLGHAGGVILIACALLLFLGLLARPVAAILCIQCIVAYIHGAAPRGPLPIRNGGEEVVIYTFVLLYFAFAGAGAWSLDEVLHKRKSGQLQPAA